jgi:hypothetical protein
MCPCLSLERVTCCRRSRTACLKTTSDIMMSGRYQRYRLREPLCNELLFWPSSERFPADRARTTPRGSTCSHLLSAGHGRISAFPSKPQGIPGRIPHSASSSTHSPIDSATRVVLCRPTQRRPQCAKLTGLFQRWHRCARQPITAEECSTCR